MKSRILLLAGCVVLCMTTACTHKEIAVPLTDAQTLTAAEAEQISAAETKQGAAETEGASFAGTGPFSAAETEQNTFADAQTIEASSIRTLPGMIMSDVHVYRMDADVSPGLKDEDAQQVKRLLASQDWSLPSYDNLSDVAIDAAGTLYYYQSDAGILSDMHDHAVRLTDGEREQLNAILQNYIDLSAPIDRSARPG